MRDFETLHQDRDHTRLCVDRWLYRELFRDPAGEQLGENGIVLPEVQLGMQFSVQEMLSWLFK